MLELPQLEETGEYFIVSAASSLSALHVPSLVSANGIIAGVLSRLMAHGTSWTISFPMLSMRLVGSVYIGRMLERRL